MPSNNTINFGIKFNTDKSSLNDLKKSLQDLQHIKLADFSGSQKELTQIYRTAQQVEEALKNAFNVNLGTLNTRDFMNQISQIQGGLDGIYSQFSKAGAQGQVAFSQIARSALTTNLQLKQTKSLIDTMGQTMANTVKWGISSSIFNEMTSSVRQALQYVQSLDSALNDIRIVTGQSTEQMAAFAQQANQAAQSLGRSTMDYSKAALTFYQQGLDEESVQARTQAVLKAQNITGAGDEMADYLTAVWNGYKVANEEAELYVDKLAKVADSSASNMSQLAIAMSKVASSANLLGVPVDSLNAQIATIVATTRQAPESVGNALKTIYSRINDIATGADDAQISLGNYSKKMLDVGISVLDANGNLRDTGDVIEQIGSKWETLSHEQQIYLARTMAGQRQYNNLLALFENWGKYSDLVNVSMQAQGATAQKNAIYMESLSAKMQQLGAAGERVKAALISEEDLKGLAGFGTGIVNLFANLIQSIGGGRNALLTFGSIFTQIFSGTITNELNNIVTHFQNVKNNAQIIANDIKTTELFGQSKGYQQAATQEMVKAKEAAQQYYNYMSQAQINSYNESVKEIGAAQNKVSLLQEQTQSAEKLIKVFESSNHISFEAPLDEVAEHAKIVVANLEQVNISFQKIKENQSQDYYGDIFKGLKENISELQTILGGSKVLEALPSWNAYKEKLEEIGNSSTITAPKLNELRLTIKALKNQAESSLNGIINYEVNTTSLKQAQAEFDLAKQKSQQFIQSIQQYSNIQNIVTLTSSVGQLASSFSTLNNIVSNVWTNQNLSGGQKLLQTLTGLGTAVPMLINVYKNFSKILGSTTLIQQQQQANTVAEIAMKKAETAVRAVNAKAIQVENLQKRQQILLSSGRYQAAAALQNKIKKQQIVLTELKTSASTAEAGAQEAANKATEKGVVSQLALNKAMLANPVFQLIAGVTALVAAITIAVKIYDHFTMSIEEANQAIEKFSESQQKLNQSNKKFADDQSKLENAKKDWDDLRKKAGSYNSTIDKLTEEQQSRYYELSNLIAEYNKDAVQGYDQQGNAILNLNTNLDDTIAKLKEKRQLQIDSTYLSKEAEQARKGQQVKYQQAKKEAEQAQNRINQFNGGQTTNYQARAAHQQQFISGIGSLRSILYQLDTENTEKDYKEKIQGFIDRLDKIDEEGFEKFAENREELQNLLSDTKNFSPDTDWTTYGLGSLTVLIDSYKSISEEFEQVNKEFEENQKLNQQQLFGLLQSSGYNQLYNKAKQAGGVAIDALLSGYFDGLTYEDFKGQKDVYDAALKQINGPEGILTKIYNTLYTDAGKDLKGQSFQKSDGTFFNLDEVLQASAQQLSKTDFKSYQEKVSTYIETINQLINNNPAFKDLLSNDKMRQSLLNYLSQTFNLQGIELKVSELRTGEKEITSQIIDNSIITQRISNLQEKFDKAIKADGNDSLKINFKQILPQNIDTTSLDIIINKFKQLKEEGIETEQAINKAIFAGQGIQNVSTTTSTVSLLQKQATGEKLDDDQQQALQSGVAKVQQIFPQLEGSLQILQNSLLQGTSIYQAALQNVVNTTMSSLEKLKNQGTMSLEETSSQILPLIQNTENLQAAQERHLLTYQDYRTALETVASKYDSCTDQLNKYILAIQTHDISQIKAAQSSLLLATRAAQQGQAFGINAERISQTAKTFLNYADAGKQGYESLKGNQQLAVDAATAYLRLNDSVLDLSDNYEKYKNLLQIGRDYGIQEVRALEDDAKAFDELKESVAGVLNTTSDLLGDDWIIDHMEDIIAAAEGDEEAINNLQETAGQEILINTGVDLSSIDTSEQQLLDKIAEIEEGAQIDMTLDENQWLNQLVWALQEAGYKQAEIESILEGLNLAVDLAPYEAGLNQAVDDAYQASDDIVNNLGFDAQTKTEKTTNKDQGTLEGFETEQIPMTADVVVPNFTGGDNSLDMEPQTMTMSFSGVRVKTTPVQTQNATAITSTALMVKNAHKKSGGNISNSTKNKVNTNNANRNKGSKGSGSKGGGKGSQPKKPKVEKKKSYKEDKKQKVKIDPYEQVTKQYQRQDRILKRIQDKQKNLTAKDRLKNLNQQNKVLEKQINILKKRQDISADVNKENSTANLRQQLKDNFKTVKFNSDGTLTDESLTRGGLQQQATDSYNKRIKTLDNQYNKYIDYYNKLSAEQQQAESQTLKARQQTYDKEKKAAEEAYKNKTQLIQDYEKAVQEDIKIQEQLIELQRQIYDQRMQSVQLKVEMKADAGDLAREYLDFEKKFIKRVAEDDFTEIAKNQLQNIQSYIASGQLATNNRQLTKLQTQLSNLSNKGLIADRKTLQKRVKNQQTILDDLRKSYNDATDKDEKERLKNRIADQKETLKTAQKALKEFNNENFKYGTDDQAKGRIIEQIKEITSTQMQSLEQVQEFIDQMQETYLDSLDNVKDKMDEHIDQYERINDILEQNMNLAKLIGGDNAYATFAKTYRLQRNINENELKTLRDQLAMWQQQMDLARDRNGNIINEQAYQKAKQNVDSLTDQINSKLENMINSLGEQADNKIDQIIFKMNKELTGGLGLDFIQQEWDYINQYDDAFKDPIERMLGVEDVKNVYQQALDGLDGNPKALKRINDLLAEQMDILENKNSLTQYDLDRAKARLEVEKAQMALEEARNNKTKMRLRRDSQGNYTYQYVADENNINNLQQQLADAQANLYNMDKQHYKETVNQITSLQQDFLEKYRAIQQEFRTATSDGERARLQNRLQLLETQYNKIYQAWQEDNDINRNTYLKDSITGYIGDLENWEDYAPYINSSMQDMINTYRQQGGLLGATKEYLAQIDDITKNYSSQLEQFLSVVGTSSKEILDVNSTLLQGAVEALKYTNQAVKESLLQVEGVKDTIAATTQYLSDNFSNAKIERYVENILQGTMSTLSDAYGMKISDFKGITDIKDIANIDYRNQMFDIYRGVYGDSQKYDNYTNNQMLKALERAIGKNRITTTDLGYENTNLDKGNIKLDTSILNLTDEQKQKFFGDLQNNFIDSYIDLIYEFILANDKVEELKMKQFQEALSNNAIFDPEGRYNKQLEQNVHIDVSFPNATNHTEIEQAFYNLMQVASQKAAGY